MNTATKLFQMGCGKEMVNSAIDRGNISAAVYNCNKMLTYYKYAVKNGIYSKEDAINSLSPYYNDIKNVEHLAATYHQLWGEKYNKAKLSIEKFMTV